ncbi:hypothetical protein ACA910_018905 [Epithemia clementina (nom. ined.)]
MITFMRNVIRLNGRVARKAGGRRRKHYGFTPRRKGDILSTKLSDEDTGRMEQDIKDFIYSNGQIPPEFEFQNRVTEQIRGSSDGSDKTMHQYPLYWGELGRFAWLCGDVATATICNDRLRPKNPLPANPETIGMFYQYKSYEKIVAVKDFSNNPALFKKGPKAGQVIVGSKLFFGNGRKKGGGWNDPTNVRKCRTAIRTLHLAFCAEDVTKNYFSVCQKCLAKNIERDGEIDWKNTINRCFVPCDTCMFHRCRPRGDPTYHAKCIAKFQRVSNFLKDKHKVKGALYLTPKQVRVLRTHIMAQGGSVKWLQLWTMFLLGIRLFLRAEEVCELKLEDFRTDCFIVHKQEGRVDQLVIKVKGKADTEVQSLSIFRDEDNPEFCPIRVLLVYLDTAKISGPYLFPRSDLLESHLEELQLLGNNNINLPSSRDPTTSPHCAETPYCYFDLLNEIKKIILTEFKGEADEFSELECTIGTHTLRKTAYMMAVFGILYRYESTGRRRTNVAQHQLQLQPLEDDALSKSARHKCVKQATLYYQNCLNKWEDCGFHNSDLWPDYKVSPWMSVFYSSGDSNRRNENPKSRTTSSILDLAKWYVTESLGFSGGHTWKEAYKAALGKQSQNTPAEELRTLFHLFPEEQRLRAECLLSECIRVTSNNVDGGEGVPQGESGGCGGDGVDGDGAAATLVTPEQVQVAGELGQRRMREQADEGDETTRKRQRNLAREESRAGPVETRQDLGDLRAQFTSLTGSNEELYNNMESIIDTFEGQNKNFVPKDFQWLRRVRTSFKKIKECVDTCHGGSLSCFLAMDQPLNRVSYRCKCPSTLAETTQQSVVNG